MNGNVRDQVINDGGQGWMELSTNLYDRGRKANKIHVLGYEMSRKGKGFRKKLQH